MRNENQDGFSERKPKLVLETETNKGSQNENLLQFSKKNPETERERGKTKLSLDAWGVPPLLLTPRPEVGEIFYELLNINQ